MNLRTHIAGVAEPKCRDCKGPNCDPCLDCPDCFPITLPKIRDLIVDVEYTIAQHAEEYVCHSLWGYNCTTLRREDLDALVLQLSVLRRVEKNLSRGFKPCISENDFKRLYDQVQFRVIQSACDMGLHPLKIDESNLGEHLVENPLCYPRESWDKYVYKYCGQIGLESIDYQVATGLIFELKSRSLPPDVLEFVFRSVKKAPKKLEIKDLSVKVRETCRVKFDILSKKYEQCKIGLSTYSKIISCGFTHTFVSKLVECGFSVDFQTKGVESCMILLTPKGTKINTCEVQSTWTEKEIQKICSL